MQLEFTCLSLKNSFLNSTKTFVTSPSTFGAAGTLNELANTQAVNCGRNQILTAFGLITYVKVSTKRLWQYSYQVGIRVSCLIFLLDGNFCLIIQ
jgi:hypothetical protein